MCVCVCVCVCVCACVCVSHVTASSAGSSRRLFFVRRFFNPSFTKPSHVASVLCEYANVSKWRGAVLCCEQGAGRCEGGAVRSGRGEWGRRCGPRVSAPPSLLPRRRNVELYCYRNSPTHRTLPPCTHPHQLRLLTLPLLSDEEFKQNNSRSQQTGEMKND